MTDSDDALPIWVVGPVSIARLHGRACWYCGAVATQLFPAGKVRLADGGRIWDIVTCGCHTRAVASWLPHDLHESEVLGSQPAPLPYHPAGQP